MKKVLISLISVLAQLLLTAYRATQYLHQLAQLGVVLLHTTLIYGIALYEILLQYAVGPLAELYAALALHTIAYGDNDIERIERDWFLYAINV